MSLNCLAALHHGYLCICFLLVCACCCTQSVVEYYLKLGFKDWMSLVKCLCNDILFVVWVKFFLVSTLGTLTPFSVVNYFGGAMLKISCLYVFLSSLGLLNEN